MACNGIRTPISPKPPRGSGASSGFRPLGIFDFTQQRQKVKDSRLAGAKLPVPEKSALPPFCKKLEKGCMGYAIMVELLQSGPVVALWIFVWGTPV
jgi:hypothetical protein